MTCHHHGQINSSPNVPWHTVPRSQVPPGRNGLPLSDSEKYRNSVKFNGAMRCQRTYCSFSSRCCEAATCNRSLMALPGSKFLCKFPGSVIVCPVAKAYSMGQIINSLCLCQCVCSSVCLSVRTLNVAFLDRFSLKLAQR